MWGDDVVACGSGGRGNRNQAVAMEDSFGGQNASQWNSAEKTPSDNFGSPMVGQGENPYQMDDMDGYDSEPKKKIKKKRGPNKRGPKEKVMKVKDMTKERKERKDRREKLHLVGLKSQMQPEAAHSAMSLGVMDNAELDYDDDMRQTGTSSSLLQLEQSWASVYTPLVDPFEADMNSPELSNFNM